MVNSRILKTLSTSIVIVTITLLAGLALECSSKSNSVTGNTQNKVTIQGSAFLPDSIGVSAGTTITWTNMDSYDHTVSSGTSTNPTTTFDSGFIAPNGTFSYTFSTVGTFVYYCKIHTYMSGKVIVH